MRIKLNSPVLDVMTGSSQFDFPISSFLSLSHPYSQRFQHTARRKLAKHPHTLLNCFFVNGGAETIRSCLVSFVIESQSHSVSWVICLMGKYFQLINFKGEWRGTQIFQPVLRHKQFYKFSCKGKFLILHLYVVIIRQTAPQKKLTPSIFKLKFCEIYEIKRKGTISTINRHLCSLQIHVF